MPWDQKRRPPGEYLHPKKKARVIATHAGICHLCGHPGAEEVDHVIAWSQWTHPTLSVHNEANLRPAHGEACPTCHATCHADKSKAEAAAGRRAAAARRAQARLRPTEPHPGALTQRDRD